MSSPTPKSPRRAVGAPALVRYALAVGSAKSLPTASRYSHRSETGAGAIARVVTFRWAGRNCIMRQTNRADRRGC